MNTLPTTSGVPVVATCHDCGQNIPSDILQRQLTTDVVATYLGEEWRPAAAGRGHRRRRWGRRPRLGGGAERSYWTPVVGFGDAAAGDRWACEDPGRRRVVRTYHRLAKPTVPAARGGRRERLLKVGERPAMVEASLYERLGRDTGIGAVVDDMYRRVWGDPAVMPYFDHLDEGKRAELRHHMVAFLVAGTGGPKTYDGQAMAEAHAAIGPHRLTVTGQAFDAVAEHLVAALDACGVPAREMDEVVQAVMPLREAIVSAV
jgi:hemoglobin